jgi:hypothetical protein
MSAGAKCLCQSCTIRSLMGPAVLITIGVLYLLQEVHAGWPRFESTWPVILLVVGLIQLGSAMASHEGHVKPVIPTPEAPPQSYPPQER